MIERDREHRRDVDVDVHRSRGSRRRRARAGVRWRSGVARSRRRRDEIGRIVAGVGAAVVRAKRRVRVGGARCRPRTFEVARRSIPDEVLDKGIGRAASGGSTARDCGRSANERDLPARRCEIARPGRVGSRKRGADRASGRQLDEVVPAGADRSRQRRGLPRRARGSGVLDRPPGHVDRRGSAVEELDVVVAEACAAVAAAAVDLADDDARGARSRPRGQEE